MASSVIKALWKYKGEGQLGVGTAELPKVMVLEGLRQGVSSHCTGWGSGVSQGLPKGRKQEAQRFWGRAVRRAEVSLEPARKTRRGAYFSSRAKGKCI